MLCLSKLLVWWRYEQTGIWIISPLLPFLFLCTLHSQICIGSHRLLDRGCLRADFYLGRPKIYWIQRPQRTRTLQTLKCFKFYVIFSILFKQFNFCSNIISNTNLTNYKIQNTVENNNTFSTIEFEDTNAPAVHALPTCEMFNIVYFSYFSI